MSVCHSPSPEPLPLKSLAKTSSNVAMAIVAAGVGPDRMSRLQKPSTEKLPSQDEVTMIELPPSYVSELISKPGKVAPLAQAKGTLFEKLLHRLFGCGQDVSLYKAEGGATTKPGKQIDLAQLKRDATIHLIRRASPTPTLHGACVDGTKVEFDAILKKGIHTVPVRRSMRSKLAAEHDTWTYCKPVPRPSVNTIVWPSEGVPQGVKSDVLLHPDPSPLLLRPDGIPYERRFPRRSSSRKMPCPPPAIPLPPLPSDAGHAGPVQRRPTPMPVIRPRRSSRRLEGLCRAEGVSDLSVAGASTPSLIHTPSPSSHSHEAPTVDPLY